MVRLFISDIDGCLAEAFTPFKLGAFRQIADFAGTAGRPGAHRTHPAFSICSGRPQGYVEAVCQTLGLRVPVLFEAGGGMYDPVTARTTWNPAFTTELADEIEDVRHWMIRDCLPGSSLMFDFNKRTQASLVGPSQDEIARFVPRVREFMTLNHPTLHVFDTPVSIDVSAPGVTKRQGIQWLSQITGIPVQEMAFIGDTNGDIGAMEVVGFAIAPANATDEVRSLADCVTLARVTDGVIEGYRWCLKLNEQLPA